MSGLGAVQLAGPGLVTLPAQEGLIVVVFGVLWCPDTFRSLSRVLFSYLYPFPVLSDGRRGGGYPWFVRSIIDKLEMCS